MAIYIGIDPGDYTGFAVWDSSAMAFVSVQTLPLWKALDEVKRWRYKCQMSPAYVGIKVVFEDARQRKWFEKESNASEYRGRLMGAGAAKRDAKVWEEFLQDNCIPFEAVKPRPGLTKWKAEYWSHVTGWKGRTSEHARDAALLVFGR